MLINLSGIYYHYCEIDGETIAGLSHADCIGRFFNANIKGHFDCRSRTGP
jgi:KTSC domain